MARLLHYQSLKHPDATPEKYLLMLHGIFGSGKNWMQIARRLIEARPDWGVILVDLPEHGKSVGLNVPATLEGAEEALHRLVEAEAIPAAGVLGHSFGGKVALRYAEVAEGVEQAWIIDSSPEPTEPGGAGWAMLHTVRDLPGPFASREQAIADLVEAGVSEPVAKWMAMNLKKSGGEVNWRFDIDRMERLLRDFYDADLWQVVEQDTNGLRLEFVKAKESEVLSDDICRRLGEAGQCNSRIRMQCLEGGHWLHIDNADDLTALLAEQLVK